MKKNRTNFLTLFLVIFLTFSGLQASAQMYKRRLDICELLYEEGRYKKALEYVDKLLKRLEKRSEEQAAIQRVLLHKAKYLEALGRYNEFEEIIADVLEKRKSQGENSLAYGVALLDIAYLYLLYSDIVSAENYLNASENILGSRLSTTFGDAGAQKDLYFDSQTLYIKTYINYLRGYYDDAQRYVTQLQKIRKQRISTREIFFNDVTGQFESRRISADQLRGRKREYVQALTLEGQIARERGEYALADSLFAVADDWIGQRFRKTKTDLATVRNVNEWILLKIERGDDIKTIRKEIEENLFRAERSVDFVHKDYINTHELILDFYTITNYRGRGKKQDWELDINIRKYYTKKRLPYAIRQRMRAKRLYYNQAGRLLTRERQLSSAEELLLILKNGKEQQQQDSVTLPPINDESLGKRQRKIVEGEEDVVRVPKNHIQRVKVLEQLYAIAMANNELDSAQSFLNELVSTNALIFGDESIPYHISKIEEADFYLNYTNEFEKAGEIFAESFDEVIAKRLNHHSAKYIEALDEYSEYLKVTGKFEEARDLTEYGLKLTEENVGKYHPFYAVELEKLIELELELGEYQVANANIDSMLKIYEAFYNKHSPLSSEYSRGLETAARYYAISGLFNEAKVALNRGDRLTRRVATANISSTSAEEQSYLMIQTEKLRQAEALLQSIIARRESVYGTESRFLIAPYNQMAMISKINGDYLKAEELAQKSYAIARQTYGDSSFKTTESLSTLAEIKTAIGSYDAAEEDLQKIIKINSQLFGEGHIQLAKPNTQMALTKFYSGSSDLNEVETLINSSVSIISKSLGTDNPVYAEALKTLALVNTESGKLEEAENNLLTANDIWVRKLKTENNTNSAEIELLLGDVEVKRKQFELAKSKFERSRKIYKKLFNKQHPEYIRATARLGRVHYMMGNLPKAIKYTELALENHAEVINRFFRAMSEAEKSRFWNTIRNDYEFYNTLAVAASKRKKSMIGKMYDNTLATKALLLNSSIKIRNDILNSNDDSLIANFEQWERLKEQLIEELGMSSEQLKEEGLDPKQTQKEIDALERQLSSQSALFSQNTEETLITWKTVQAELKDNEVAVEIIRYRQFTNQFSDSVIYAALVVTPKTAKAPLLLVLPNGNDLEGKYLKYYRTCIEYKIEDQYSYENFWRPIDQVVPDGSKVFLSAEGAYNQINLEAVLNDNGEYVLDRSNIVLVSNTKEIVDDRRDKEENKGMKAKSEQLALFGNPVYYSDLKPEEYNTYTDRPITQLPGTQAEVKTLTDLLLRQDLAPDTKINLQATEDAVGELDNPKVFHIATHGYFMADEVVASNSDLAKERSVSNPLLRSGLLLTNAGDLMKDNNVYNFNKGKGVLTAYEAMSLRLDETELVVLSACETGRGDVRVGDGVYGLQRAFLVAGADAIIMSLFKVDDEATKKLMNYFYNNWIVKKMDKRKAFIEAKRELRQEFKDPIYWGAFIMVGSV
ncbi:MAG: CHAT domain-containing tetratricopeptide repeat protein [Flammeovirgaceae bacterium]